jgi:hypothetical protein
MSYSIYVSNNGGAFALWLGGTTQTSAVYTGVNGHTYAFYSRAQDQAGNVEAAPTAAQATTLVYGPIALAQAPQINGNLSALAGAQRSMVRDIVYTFNHPVSLGAGAFTIALHAGVTVTGNAGQTVGTLPTLNWSSPDGGVTWVVTFSGAGVVGGSIADGVYDLTLNHAAVTDALGQTLAADRVDTFFRLFGDINGDRQVNTLVDYTRFKAALGTNSTNAGYVAAFDYNADGQINTLTDYTQFKNRLGKSFGGFTPTI